MKAARLVARTLIVAIACLVLSGMPVQAQNVNLNINWNQSPEPNQAPAYHSNWYEYHHTWQQRCYAEPSHGHWGRDRQWDKWCYSNLRFRHSDPDHDWRHDHPWDHGREYDHSR